jgi:predicted AAA+ superfamily ATPase
LRRSCLRQSEPARNFCGYNPKNCFTLTGRYVSFRIYPLSFAEYLIFRKEYISNGIIFPCEFPVEFKKHDPYDNLYEEFARYLRYGGFPAIHLQDYSYEDAYTIVRDICNSTIFADIVKRNQIRKVDRLERIVRFVIDNVGRTFSAASISKYLKSENRAIDNETVYNYLEKLESAYIIHRCARYDVQGKEILKTQEKFYLADTAFRPKYVLRTDAFAGGNYEGVKTMHIADFLLGGE